MDFASPLFQPTYCCSTPSTPSGCYLTAGPELPLVPLKGNVDCDCLVVGGGWMGLHAVRRYAELNPDAAMVLVDAGRIGTTPPDVAWALPST